MVINPEVGTLAAIEVAEDVRHDVFVLNELRRMAQELNSMLGVEHSTYEKLFADSKLAAKGVAGRVITAEARDRYWDTRAAAWDSGVRLRELRQRLVQTKVGIAEWTTQVRRRHGDATYRLAQGLSDAA